MTVISNDRLKYNDDQSLKDVLDKVKSFKKNEDGCWTLDLAGNDLAGFDDSFLKIIFFEYQDDLEKLYLGACGLSSLENDCA